MKIKKTIAIVLSLALGACLLTGCDKDAGSLGDNGNPDDGQKPGISQNSGEYSITFDANGGTFGTSTTFTTTTTNGKLGVGSMPQNPTYSGYEFDMWTDSSGKIFSLATTYTADTTYKAQWTGGGNTGNDNNNGDNNQGGNDNNNGDDNNQGNGDNSNDDNNFGNDDTVSGDITFVFSTGWDDAVTDVRIHLWSDGGEYTTYLMDDWLDIGGDLMTDNYDGTYSYTVTPDYRGDVVGVIVTFTQDGATWKRAKSTECLYSFTVGNTYNLAFADWNNSIYGTIDWDTWAVIPFDLTVS